MSDLVDKVKAEIGAPTWRGWGVMESVIGHYEIDVDDLAQVMRDAWFTSQTDGQGRNGWDVVAEAILDFLPARPSSVELWPWSRGEQRAT